MTLDMTRGNPMGRILRFALPLMLSTLLQQLYTFCDGLIVSRFLGSVALTATGAAGNLNWFPQNLLFCAINGFAVTLSQRFGAKDREGFRGFFAGTVVLGMLLGVLVCVLGMTCVVPALRMLDTPAELLESASIYLRILWLGYGITAVMNISSSALLAMGDSKTPLISLAISSVVNIVLDLCFLTWIPMGIGGAALATVLAQAASAGWNLLRLMKTPWALPKWQDFRLRWPVVRELLRLGVPPMVSSCVINSGDLLVQTVINGCGVAFVMGINAARRYFSLLNVVGSGLEVALATYVGQNWGAGDIQRIRRGCRAATLMGFVTAAVTGLGAWFAAEPLIRFLLPDGSAETIRVGVELFRLQGVFLFSLYMLCEFRASLQGMGNALLPMLSGFSELIFRVGTVLLLPGLIGRWGIYLTDVMAWVPTMLLMIAGYRILIVRAAKR